MEAPISSIFSKVQGGGLISFGLRQGLSLRIWTSHWWALLWLSHWKMQYWWTNLILSLHAQGYRSELFSSPVYVESETSSSSSSSNKSYLPTQLSLKNRSTMLRNPRRRIQRRPHFWSDLHESVDVTVTNAATRRRHLRERSNKWDESTHF